MYGPSTLYVLGMRLRTIFLRSCVLHFWDFFLSFCVLHFWDFFGFFVFLRFFAFSCLVFLYFLFSAFLRFFCGFAFFLRFVPSYVFIRLVTYLMYGSQQSISAGHDVYAPWIRLKKIPILPAKSMKCSLYFCIVPLLDSMKKPAPARKLINLRSSNEETIWNGNECRLR